MLEQVAHFNDFSPTLRKQLEEKIAQLGKRVKYKFDISHPNPDPEKHNGDTIWPTRYTLDPIVFDVVDQNEKREGKQKLKKVGIVNKVDKDGKPESFFRVHVHGRDKGVVTLDMSKPEDQKMAMYLELHPKLRDGSFADKDKKQVFHRVDEMKDAEASQATRKAKAIALSTAVAMTPEKILEFANAMQWDNTDDVAILRNKVEEMAETTPDMFNDLANTKKLEYQATIKKAIDKVILSFDPVEGRWTWASSGQIITLLGTATSGKTDIERFAEWLMTSGKTGDEVYTKIKSLT